MARPKEHAPRIVTQVRLEPELHHKLKIKLAQEQQTFQNVVTDFLKSYVTQSTATKKVR